nr:putative 14kDA protein [Grapevine rupestris stem pitting-associated virus]
MRMKSLQPLTSSLESQMRARLNLRVVSRELQQKQRWSLILPLLKSRYSDRLWLKESGAPILEKLVVERLGRLSTTPLRMSRTNKVDSGSNTPYPNNHPISRLG